MPPDAPVLGFDTSAAHCAAAVVFGERVLAERHEAMATGQAERLFPLLEELLAEAGLGWRDLGGVGAGTGPGNFTGIRIAVAAARGLALSLKVPAIGVTRFEAETFGVPRPCVAVVDARRGQVYFQRLDGSAPVLADWAEARSAAGRPMPEGADATDGGGDLPAPAGAALPLVSAGGEPGTIAPALPLAVALARIAALRITGGERALPVPLYIRPADAAAPRARAPSLRA